jgi:hypothetical protein
VCLLAQLVPNVTLQLLLRMVVDMANEDELIEKFNNLKNEIQEKLVNFSESKRLELQIRRKEFYLITEKLKELNLELEEIRLQIKVDFEEGKQNEKYSVVVLFVVYLISLFFEASEKTITVIFTIYVALFFVNFLNKRITQTTNVVLRNSKMDSIANYKFLLRKAVGTPYLEYAHEYTELINKEYDYDENESSEDTLIKGIYDASLTSAIIDELADKSIYLHRNL